MQRKSVSLPAKVGLAVVLAGIGVGVGSLTAIAVSDAGSFILGDEMDRAWRATAVDTDPDLPEGYEWPAESPVKAGHDVQVEVGVLATTRAFYWMCAWEDDYFAAGSDEERAEALKALPSLGEFEAMREASDSVAVWVDSVVVPARAGDAAPMRADYAASCTAFAPYFPEGGR